MGPVEKAIRDHVVPGETLCTIPDRAAFSVGEMSVAYFRLIIGSKPTQVRISWKVLEGIVPFLKTRASNCVEIGAVHAVVGKENSLDQYLKDNGPRVSTGSYIAAVLERARVVEAPPARPAVVCLRKAW